MKKFLFLALFLIISSQESNSEDTIKLFKCLLLDSNVVYDHVNSLVQAVETMDPAKLVTTFTTIYPAISAEVIRCSTGKNELAMKKEEKEEETKVVKMEEKKSSSSDFPITILKLIAQYVVPILKKFGINLSSICKMIFPDLVYCDIIDFLA